jgi:hypothetical protein
VEVLELLRGYPKWRFQGLVLGQLAASFVSLRGHLSDTLRDINFLRTRLGELARLLQDRAAGLGPPPAGPGPLQGTTDGGRRTLFVSGSTTLAEAVEHFLGSFTAEYLAELDARAEELLKTRFGALCHVCLQSGNVLRQLEPALIELVRDYAAGLLPACSVAELFFEQTADPESAEAEVAQLYTEAAPEISPPVRGRGLRPLVQMAELCLVTTPPGSAGERFVGLLRQAMPAAEVQHTVGGEDILVYRERNNLALEDLEQLGPRGLEAYTQMSAAENFTPHSRCDVAFRQVQSTD